MTIEYKDSKRISLLEADRTLVQGYAGAAQNGYNTGQGGGGSSNGLVPGIGGSGIVIIRYVV